VASVCTAAVLLAVIAGDDGPARAATGKPLSLVIVPGGQSLAVGDRLRLALVARYEDGSVRNVTASARWASTAPRIVKVGPRGTAHGLADGRATVTARAAAGKATTTVAVGRRSLGPLRVSGVNPRYFVDGAGRVVYLAGDHTWGNLQDNGTTDPPPRFDYARFLDYLQTYDVRVFRLWAWEQASIVGGHGAFWVSPSVYRRTGPGVARDGKPRFDLRRFDPVYFERLRERVVAARERGLYVIVMLFDGWSVEPKGTADNPWDGHPFNRANNVNGVDGDPAGVGSGRATHTLAFPRITRLQEAYVERVIRAVGDQPNVLYEVSNESSRGSMAWQDHIMRFIRSHERPAFRHPVGTTVEYPGGSNDELFGSVADWVAPNGDIDDPAPSSGRKVVLADTDHFCGICGTASFPWRAFTRGLNPMFMDPYNSDEIGLGALGVDPNDPRWAVVRRRLGVTQALSERLDLKRLVPAGALASTGYCLADTKRGTLYVVYLPDGGNATIDLTASASRLRATWIDPDTGAGHAGGVLEGGGTRTVNAPRPKDAVLILRAVR
jgi:hypothetical protein